MTNTIVQLTNTMQQFSIPPFTSGESWFSRYASEIVVAIITATLVGGGAVLWQYFAQPFLAERQKKREATKRKNELLKTLGDVQPSLEWRPVDGECIAITLKNNTTKPVVIREVALLPHPGGRIIMWHDEKDRICNPKTQRTRTGVEMIPFGEATWRFGGDIKADQPMVITKCQVEFEYQLSPDETAVEVMTSPSSKDGMIKSMAEMWWNNMQKRLLEGPHKK